MSRYILAVDQSTQGTKGLLFEENGILIARADRPHRQIVNEKGWVEHDPMEILENTIGVCGDVLAKSKANAEDVAAIGISNQRETALMWDKATGRPVCNAIVWQCARAADICERPEILERAEDIRTKTGLKLSPYFPAAKFRWLMEEVPEAKSIAAQGKLACGTIDSWLVYCLTGNHKTDYSNASRTQLFNIVNLTWDESLCRLFSVPLDSLPEVCMSDADFGKTDLRGLLPRPIPIHGVLGDSHGALLGQGCRRAGQLKATYGTGSSVMMHIGDKPKFSVSGLVTSLAWGMNGTVEHVFEGNLNYTGAVMTWLREEVGLIRTDAEATELALKANPLDRTYFVPAFTGLGAPYWASWATGLFTGITRTTGRAEIAKACLDCIAYQITDLIEVMRQDSGIAVDLLRADGGPTASKYLMQFQSDIADVTVQVPDTQEMSGLGAAFAAGSAIGLYNLGEISARSVRKVYRPEMPSYERDSLYVGWRCAVRQATGDV